MILRFACPDDIEHLLALSLSIEGGMTSLPKEDHAWVQKIELVQKSVENTPDKGAEALYFLVLEDEESGEIAGTAAVHTGVGLNRPFYNYKLSKHVKTSEELGITVVSNTLNLVNDFTGDTELGSLFLKPEFRGGGNGKFLSQGRFAMMKDFSDRFGEHVFAEIRGWVNERGESPFWEHLGSKFFNIDYKSADAFSAVKGSQFISDLMPQHPVYLELLPSEAVDVIAKPHKDSASAMNYLLNEGFRYQGAIDIFDAGPVVECDRAHIESLSSSEIRTVVGFSGRPAERPELILTNRNLTNYRMTLSSAELIEDDKLVLPDHCRDSLGVCEGSEIQLMKLR